MTFGKCTAESTSSTIDKANHIKQTNGLQICRMLVSFTDKETLVSSYCYRIFAFEISYRRLQLQTWIKVTAICELQI